MEFKDIFIKLRKESGYTQNEIAEELGVTQSQVSNWELGKRHPSKGTYEQIADFFNVDIDYLYGRIEIRKTVHYDADGTEYVPVKHVLSPMELDIIEHFRLLDESAQTIVLMSLGIADKWAKPESRQNSG